MKYSKVLEQLGVDVVQEIENKTTPELETLIADSTQAIRQATQERDANPQYQAAKQAVTDLSQGLKEVKKHQGAKIQLALMLRSNDAAEE